MRNESNVLVPVTAVTLFRSGQPSRAVRAWILALTSAPTHQVLGKQLGLKTSTFSSKASGFFAWKEAELLKLYEYLGTQQFINPEEVESIAVNQLLSWSGPGPRNTFLFPNKKVAWAKETDQATEIAGLLRELSEETRDSTVTLALALSRNERKQVVALADLLQKVPEELRDSTVAFALALSRTK